MDQIDPDLLRGALRRREKAMESIVSPDNPALDVPSGTEQIQTMTISDTLNPPGVLKNGPIPDPSHIQGQNTSQEHNRLDSISFGPFTDDYGIFGVFNATQLHGRVICVPCWVSQSDGLPGDACPGSEHSMSEDLNLAGRGSYTLSFAPSLVDELCVLVVRSQTR